MLDEFASLLTPYQRAAIEDATFLRRLAEDFKRDGARYFGEGKLDAARVCHDRIEQLMRMADRIEATAGVPIDV